MTASQKLFNILVICAFLAGCSVSTPTIQATPLEQKITGTPTTRPIQLPTSSLTPSPSPTATPPGNPECLDVNPNFIFSDKSQGVAVLAGINPGSSDVLLEMSTGEEAPLPNDRRDTALSPNRQFFVFHSGTKINIISGDGRVVKSLPWNASWREIASWIGDNTILISKKGEKIDSMIALDPWTGKTGNLIPNFPGVYQIYPYPHWGGGYSTSQTFYAPALDKVIYIPTLKDNYESFVFWDLNNQGEITHWSRGSEYYVYPPQWSPDGSKFVINIQQEKKTLDDGSDQVKQELFQISNDGESTKLTNFSSNYENIGIGNFSWSPNGQLIAFSVNLSPIQYPQDYTELHNGGNYRPKDTYRLVILDTVSRTLTNYCVPAGSGLYSPVWSPDSNYVLVTDDYEHFSPNKSLVFWVDIQGHEASVLEKDAIALGWLK